MSYRDLEIRRLAAIVDSSDDAIVSKDLNGIVTSWNRAAEKMFGYTAQEMVGRSIRLIIPADRQSEEDDVLSRIRKGLKVDHFETLRQHKDGTLVPISLSVSPILDADGRVIGASKIARDISDRKQAEQERVRAYEQLQLASRLKDEFLATFSHELRTPLNAVLGYAGMLRSGVVPQERVQSALEVLDRNATALSQIVEDVLDVARIVAGKVRLNLQAIDVEQVLEDSVDTVKPTASAKHIRIQCTLGKVGPVLGDPDRLQQVFWNLLSNAVKFTPPGGRMEVRLDKTDSHAQITVKDNGVGIAPEFLPHIFERFKQADTGTTRQHGGLGLGLAITRHIIEMHGGMVQAQSEGKDKGSTFRVLLPLAVDAENILDDTADQEDRDEDEREMKSREMKAR